MTADKFLYRRLYLVSHLSHPGHNLLVAAGEGRRIGEGPMQSLREARKDRAALGRFLRTDGDDNLKDLLGIKKVIDAFRGVARDVDADLGHGANDEGIELPRLKASAFGLESVTAMFPEKCLCHLAAS